MLVAVIPHKNKDLECAFLSVHSVVAKVSILQGHDTTLTGS
jgi:hypothetical protein